MSESSPEDRAEQHASAGRDDAAPRTPDVPVEADPADAVEQASDAGPGEHVAARELPLEADEADAAEQAYVVELDEDEVREG